MEIVIEGLGLCLILFLLCYIGKRNGAVDLVYLYEKNVQERVVELGLTTFQKIKENATGFKIMLLASFLVYTVICVYGINGARGFGEGFGQIIAILFIEGLFDRIVIDGFWVGCTRSWIISGTEDLMPYIPMKVHIKKWIVTVVLYLVAASLIAGIMAIFLK